MIYLLRHGLDDEQYIGGWSDVSLVRDGIKQVELVKDYISNNIEFNKIISSDILRAKQTAEIINKNFNKEIIYTDLLREQSKGDYNGKLKSSIDDNDYFLGNTTIYDTYPNGESLLDLYFRIEKLLLIMDTHSPDKVRVNAVLSSIDEFYNTFDIQETDEMYKEKRIKVW